MGLKNANGYKVEVIDNSEWHGMRKGKWKELLGQIKPQLRATPAGKSVKITFTEASEVKSFSEAARNVIIAWGMKNYYIGKSYPEMAVYIGRK